MDPGTKNDSDKTQGHTLPDSMFLVYLTANKIDILIKQLLCQFERF